MSARFATCTSRELEARLLYGVLLLTFAITVIALLEYARLHQHGPSDYDAFRSYARFIRVHPPALIYDNEQLRRFQGLRGPFFPYFYPPTMLLLIWPIACLPYTMGWVAWSGIGLLAYVAAVSIPRVKLVVIFAAVIAPSTLWVVLCGQSTLLAAALLLGGFRLLPRRPLLAGMLFGLLTYKPQFGVLVPVALVAADQWRAITAACMTTILLVLTSGAAFGWAVWTEWLHHLTSISAIITMNMMAFSSSMPTVMSNLMMFGSSKVFAESVQLISGTGAAVVVWCCFRHSINILGATVVAVAAFLITPFAFGYDMPILTAAVIVLVDEHRQRHNTFRLIEIFILTASFLLPYWIISVIVFRFSSLIILALLWIIVRYIWTYQTAAVREAVPSSAIPVVI